MKKALLAAVAVVALGIPGFAGVPVVTSKQAPAPEPECFKAGEIQLDVFGSWDDPDGHHRRDSFGGGLGVGYFITRNIGFDAEGSISDNSRAAIWNPNGNVILRFPIDTHCIAPYIFGGGGGRIDGRTTGEGHVGGGLEYRATSKIGIFADGRHGWGGDNEFTTVRVGVRFTF